MTPPRPRAPALCRPVPQSHHVAKQVDARGADGGRPHAQRPRRWGRDRGGGGALGHAAANDAPPPPPPLPLPRRPPNRKNVTPRPTTIGQPLRAPAPASTARGRCSRATGPASRAVAACTTGRGIAVRAGGTAHRRAAERPRLLDPPARCSRDAAVGEQGRRTAAVGASTPRRARGGGGAAGTASVILDGRWSA